MGGWDKIDLISLLSTRNIQKDSDHKKLMFLSLIAPQFADYDIILCTHENFFFDSNLHFRY